MGELEGMDDIQGPCDPNPLPLGLTNVIEEDLEDRQPNQDLATEVAQALIDRYSQPRYSGSIELVEADSLSGSNPYEIRSGDKVTVTDWGPAQSMTLRVSEVEYTQDSVTISVEDHVPWERVLALASHREARRPKRRRRRR